MEIQATQISIGQYLIWQSDVLNSVHWRSIQATWEHVKTGRRFDVSPQKKQCYEQLKNRRNRECVINKPNKCIRQVLTKEYRYKHVNMDVFEEFGTHQLRPFWGTQASKPSFHRSQFSPVLNHQPGAGIRVTSQWAKWAVCFSLPHYLFISWSLG